MLPARYKIAPKGNFLGGYSNVQRVHDTFLDRDVLFKTMHSAANNAQLETEIRSLSKVRSRHVVEIYDVIYDKGKVGGIIIEELTGREFSNFHNEFKNNPDGYLRLLFQIATALKDLHAEGIVHRDIKLDNLRQSAAGLVKLFDFGIAYTDAQYTTKNNRGTLTYAAPELYAPGAKVTAEMDVYAFGVCAWALASDKMPKVLLEQPPQKSALAPSIDIVAPGLLPSDVFNLLDSCLDPDPGQRPKAAQLSEELGIHLVRGRHRGLFVRDTGQTIYELSAAKTKVAIKIAGQGELNVGYDGLVFTVVSTSGDVFINNRPAAKGDELHKACVLTFGSNGASRTYIQFTCSHPEIIL